MNLQVFDNDDDAYLKYLNKNLFSYIVNTRRGTNTTYFWIHEFQCHHISTVTHKKKGAYTERDYIKVCSDDLNELGNWFFSNKPNFSGKFKECKTCNPFSTKFIKNLDFLFPETISQEGTVLTEGAKTKVTVNSYERNLKARKKCLDHYGYSCSVCQINFEDAYGIIGKQFIHVHHLKEISAIGSKYVVDPIADLKPLCPNCHAMIHQRKPCFSIEELKKIYEKEQNK